MIQMRLHRQYGQGLNKLKSQLNEESHPLLTQEDPSTSDGRFVVVNNYQFDTQDWKSLPLGAISALQYDNQTFGSCFYATVSLLDFVTIFEKDIENLLNEYDFYGLLVYDPIHFLDAYFVVYE
jgi:hypothetical protein